MLTSARTVLVILLTTISAFGLELLDAAREGDAAKVKALLAKRGVVDEAMPDGTTALAWAAHEGHADVVEMLLGAERADVGRCRSFARDHSRAGEGGCGHRSEVQRRGDGLDAGRAPRQDRECFGVAEGGCQGGRCPPGRTGCTVFGGQLWPRGD